MQSTGSVELTLNRPFLLAIYGPLNTLQLVAIVEDPGNS